MEINKNNYEAFFLDYHEGTLSVEEVAALLLFVEQHPELKEEFENFENITLDDLSSIEFSDKSLLKKEITDTNKEHYFIGHIENTLNEAEKKLFADFIAQEPSATNELELYKNTIAIADTTLAFENKNELKRNVHLSSEFAELEYLLIAATENSLSTKEKTTIDVMLAGNNGTKEQLELYLQTKLIPDTTIVFEEKEKLKQKAEKVVPFYYYIAAAASILLLLGFFFFNKTDNPVTIAEAPLNLTQPVKQTPVMQADELTAESVKSIKKKQEVKSTPTKKNDNSISTLQSASNTIAAVPEKVGNMDTAVLVKNKEEVIIENNEGTAPTLTFEKQMNPSSAKLEEPSIQAPEYVSLRELAAEKIKEKLLDENTIAIQKKNGQTKKLNGWDIAQIVTKGISKLSGRDLELKPHYNEDGSITSYAFSAGEFKISKKL